MTKTRYAVVRLCVEIREFGDVVNTTLETVGLHSIHELARRQLAELQRQQDPLDCEYRYSILTLEFA